MSIFTQYEPVSYMSNYGVGMPGESSFMDKMGGRNTFDIRKFNTEFEEYEREIAQRRQAEILKKEAEANKPVYKKINLSKMAIGIKNTWFGIIAELFKWNISSDIFTKNDRPLYIGITLLLIGLFYSFFGSINPNKSGNKKIYLVKQANFTEL